MVIESKKEIRKQLLEHREALDLSMRIHWDESIFNKLVNSEFYAKAQTIFAFVSFKSEVDTHKIIKYAIDDGKTICVPKVKSKEAGMELYRIEGLNQLEKGYFGVLEPIDGCPIINKKDIDLVLMPGVGFDRFGGRIGYGAAFYDRFLATISEKVNKIALAYQFQVVDKVPVDEHDILINGIITENEIILTNKK